jgi:hypothetical protein
VKLLVESTNVTTADLRRQLRFYWDTAVRVSNARFQVDLLKTLSETEYQNAILTSISGEEGSWCLDTHSSNHAAKFLCVSPRSNEGKIYFNAKPDAVMSRGPLMVEVKSAVKAKSKAASTTWSAAHSILGEGSTGAGSDVALVIEDAAVSSVEGSFLAGKNLTLVESDILQQSLERILEQAQFRAYLSKFIVFASTGHFSWCFHYTQNFDRSIRDGKFKRLNNTNPRR